MQPTYRPSKLRRARKFGFRLVSHKMELYGLCAECRKGMAV